MRSFISLFLSVAVLGSLTGCRRSSTRADFVICNGAEPKSLDPAIITGQPDLRVVGALFEGLTRLDPQTALAIPAIAERWDLSPDLKTYTFHLRTNAAWSTGDPITSEDFVYSWRRVVDPATASEYAGQLYFVKNGQQINSGEMTDLSQLGVRALGRHTLEVELTTPTPFFIDLCAFRTLAVVPRQTIEKHGDYWLHAKPLPTSGAYELVFWRIHDRIRVRKNPHYWDVQNVRNNVVDFLPLESATTALNLYATGAADIIWDKDLIPTDLLDSILPRPDSHTFQFLGTYFVRFNVLRAPFQDVRVRKALCLAIDKKRIVERITGAGEPVASHFTPLGVANYVAPEGLGYDPDLARKLLAEAGYPGGKGFPRFSYLFNSTRLHERIGVEMQEMWKRELGITVELRQAEWQVYLDAQTALEYETCRGSWIGDYNDANTFLDVFMSHNGNNRTGWTNTVYDGLIRSANEQVSTERRAALMRDAETILVRDEVPIMPLFFYVGVCMYDAEKIAGIHFNILDEHPVHAIHWK